MNNVSVTGASVGNKEKNKAGTGWYEYTVTQASADSIHIRLPKGATSHDAKQAIQSTTGTASYLQQLYVVSDTARKTEKRGAGAESDRASITHGQELSGDSVLFDALRPDLKHESPRSLLLMVRTFACTKSGSLVITQDYNSTVGADGMIYLIPTSNGPILRVDPTKTMTEGVHENEPEVSIRSNAIICVGHVTVGHDDRQQQWVGAATAPGTGVIYCVPFNHTQVLKVEIGYGSSTRDGTNLSDSQRMQSDCADEYTTCTLLPNPDDDASLLGTHSNFKVYGE